MKGKLGTCLLALMAVAGLCLMLYPTVSDWWNSSHQTRVVVSYGDSVALADEADISRILENAREYNERIAEEGNSWVLSDSQKAEYESQLVIPGSDVMGYVDIPKIDCTLPLHHGTDEAVLQVAIGHIEGSSLPVGGEGTHSVVSGHRGLPSARLFTDLDQMKVGDSFTLHVLDLELTYQVDQIRTVLPHQTELLEVVEGQDLCTLVTCTPYGVNSHRLLVRGHRVDETMGLSSRVAADATFVDQGLVALCVASPLLVILLVVAFGRLRKGA